MEVLPPQCYSYACAIAQSITWSSAILRRGISAIGRNKAARMSSENRGLVALPKKTLVAHLPQENPLLDYATSGFSAVLRG